MPAKYKQCGFVCLVICTLMYGVVINSYAAMGDQTPRRVSSAFSSCTSLYTRHYTPSTMSNPSVKPVVISLPPSIMPAFQLDCETKFVANSNLQCNSVLTTMTCASGGHTCRHTFSAIVSGLLRHEHLLL